MDASVTAKNLERLLAGLVRSGALPNVTAQAATTEGETYRFACGVTTLGDDHPLTTDTVIWLASMTKLIVAVAALQQVERGALGLDTAMADVVPALGRVQVLDGFDAAGDAQTRPARAPITMRQLLSHTAGYAYSTWNPRLKAYQDRYRIPDIFECREITLTLPLMFEPGSSWEYGMNIDWVGKAVEQVSGMSLERYLRKNVLGPLGMTRTSFVLDQRMRSDLAGMHHRGPDGVLSVMEFEVTQTPEFFMSGGAMYGSAGDYLRLLRALLNLGTLDGVQVLRPETVVDAAGNQLGELSVRPLATLDPTSSNDVTLMPRMGEKWSLLGLRNESVTPNGRSQGSMFWCGMANCYYWVDWQRGDTGLLCTQVLPFVDPVVLDAFDSFERAIHHPLWASPNPQNGPPRAISRRPKRGSPFEHGLGLVE
jgi:methyl acetate hydrolase